MRIEDIEVPIRDLWNPLTCPESLLPWLAWALSIDDWNAGWPEEIKRRMIEASIATHRVKGTIGAMKRAISTLGHTTRVQEWFDYGGAPYHFKVILELTEKGISEAEQEEIVQIASSHKNVRSVMEFFIIYLSRAGVGRYGSVMYAGESTTIYPTIATEIRQHTVLPRKTAIIQSVDQTIIYPKAA